MSRGIKKGAINATKQPIAPAHTKPDFISLAQLRAAAANPDSPEAIAVGAILRSWMTKEQFDQAVHIAHTLARKPFSEVQDTMKPRPRKMTKSTISKDGAA